MPEACIIAFAGLCLTYRSEIDGLRAVAVLAVVLFHGWPSLLPGGFIGVDIFFVVSGFLIGRLLLAEMADGRVDILAFYARRVRRVYPALLVVVSSTLIIGMFVLAPREFVSLKDSALFAVFGLSNIFFWRSISYFAADAEFWPLLMTWSLGVEEQFYLLAPFVLLVLRRFSVQARVVILLAGCAVSFALAVALTRSAPTAAYYLMPTRWFELGAGLALAAAWQHPLLAGARASRAISDALGAAGCLIIALGLATLDEKTGFPGPFAVVPVFGTLLVLAAGQGRIAAALSLQPLVFVGRISYALYLVALAAAEPRP
jgi:peptidoglycan/LPS O-acetylase OafA/YrhL